LRFAEVSRALRALSSSYVERRAKIGEGAALSGAGKRAAFALFYGPLHFLFVKQMAKEFSRLSPAATIVDLGCGTGAAGAALAVASGHTTEIVAVDRHPWAVDEARRTYRAFGLRARVQVQDLQRTALPPRSLALAAYALNELDQSAREAVGEQLLDHAARGGAALIVEPLAGFVSPWWKTWTSRWEAAGGRADEWRFRVPLPPMVAKLDKAAGLRHETLTGKTLSLNVSP
jgi:SAM-dependent methyltransferase